jgi:hypothetical protein
MKRFSLLAILVALTALVATDSASSQSGGRGLPPSGSGKSKKAHRIHGHSFLNPQRMRSLNTGRHHVHSHNGHRIHASLRGGRLHALHVTDKRGRNVAVSKRLVRGRATQRTALDTDPVTLALAGTDLEGQELMDVSQVGLQIFVVFSFRDPFTGQRILMFFPLSSVGGIAPPADPTLLPVDPNVPVDPTGGDDGTGDPGM